MDKNFIASIEAVSQFINETHHEDFARRYLKLVNSNLVELVTHYTKLKTQRPKTYLEEIMSGRMAKLFRRAMSYEESTAMDIWVIVNAPEHLKELTQAVQINNSDANISLDDAESAALSITRELMGETKGIMALKKEMKSHAEYLRNKKQIDDAYIGDVVANLLTTDYMR